MYLLLGSTGYVGNAISAELTRQGLPFKTLRRGEADFDDSASLTAAIKTSGATAVINSAGYTGKPNVDACEQDKTECVRGNVILPGKLREACESLGIPLGHVSSGCIFTGTREDGSGFTEADAPNFSFRTDNCSFYSGTKAPRRRDPGGLPGLLHLAASHPVQRIRLPPQLSQQGPTLRPIAGGHQQPVAPGRIRRRLRGLAGPEGPVRHLQCGQRRQRHDQAGHRTDRRAPTA